MEKVDAITADPATDAESRHENQNARNLLFQLRGDYSGALVGEKEKRVVKGA